MLQGSINQADGSNAVRGLYSFNGKGSAFFHGIITFFLSGLGAAAIPARLRLRKNLGERAFSPFALIISLVFYVYIVYSPLINLIWPDKEGNNIFSDLLAILLLLISSQYLLILLLVLALNSFNFFIIKTLRLGYLHFQKVYSKSESSSYQYSYYRGDPINTLPHKKIGKTFFGYTVDEKLVRIYFEPKDFIIKHLILGLLFLIISFLLAYFKLFKSNIYSEDKIVLASIVFFTIFIFFYSLSNFILSFSGLCLLLEELAIAKKIRDSVLDMYDGEYDMKFIMKQKELLESKSLERESVDIAESIFQNSEPIDMALLPTFNPFAINDYTTPAVNNFETQAPLNKKPDTTTIMPNDTPSKSKKIKKQLQNKIEGDTDLDNFMAKIME